jgi:hypothetical protein
VREWFGGICSSPAEVVFQSVLDHSAFRTVALEVEVVESFLLNVAEKIDLVCGRQKVLLINESFRKNRLRRE